MPVCPVCSKELSGESTLCVACGTPHDSECWDYNGQCATFGCGSTVHGKGVATIDDFVEKYLDPVHNDLSALLWRTPHQKERDKFISIYYAGVHGVITPPNAHNQLLEGLRIWKSYYHGRLE